MADWSQIELDNRFDSELSRRRVMFVRAGSMISYPTTDQTLVDEVIRLADQHDGIRSTDRDDGMVTQQGDRVVFDREFGAKSSLGPLSEFLTSFGGRCNLWFYLQRQVTRQQNEAGKGRIVVVPNQNLTSSGAGQRIDFLGFKDKDDEIREYPMGYQSYCYNPSGAGVSVMDDLGTPVTEVIPGMIAILVPLVTKRHLWAYSILLKIFSRSIGFAIDEKKWESEFEKQKRFRLQNYREQYVELVKARSKGDMERATEDLKRMTSERDNLARDLTNAIREIDRLDLMVGGLANRNGDFDKRARVEFDKICEIPEIVGLAVDQSGVKAMTSELYIDQKWHAGAYEITINLDGKVTIRNMTNAKKRSYETIDHPHVKMNVPCWGNLQSGIVKMISNYDFGAVLQITLEYLKTYNPDDPWGKSNIPLWKDDLVKNEKKT